MREIYMWLSETIRKYAGWCPNAPALSTAPAVLIVPPATMTPADPGNDGAAGSSGRIRRGIGIATGSIRALFRERHLLWFTFLAGIIILFLFVAEGWSVTHYDFSLLPYSIWIPFGDGSLIVFNMQLFLIEAICLSCFTWLLVALVLYQSAGGSPRTLTIRQAFTRANTHAASLAALPIVMALVATLVFEMVSQSQFIGKIFFAIDMAFFFLPYAYYFSNDLTSMYYFSFKVMIINIVLFLLALYVVPAIVLEGRGLLSALARSATLMKKTWRELLGCVIVLLGIVLAVAAVGLLIGQSPLLLNHDYDFFLQMSRGQIPMTIACYGFIAACSVLMAIGTTVLGVAVTELYAGANAIAIPAVPANGTPSITEPVR